MTGIFLLSLTSIFVLYFLFAFLGEQVKYLAGRKICAICAAVSLTWFGLFLLSLAGFKIDPVIIGVFMGGSVVGIMYQSQGYFKKKNLRRFWLLRILIIVLGFSLAYFLLLKEWLTVLVLLGAGFVSTPIVLSVTKAGKKGDDKGDGKERKEASAKLEKLLEDCC